jgi:hypothetical protein
VCPRPAVRRAPASNTLNPSIATAPTTIRMQECPRLAWQRQAPPPGRRRILPGAANAAGAAAAGRTSGGHTGGDDAALTRYGGSGGPGGCRRRGASHARRQHGLVGWGGISLARRRCPGPRRHPVRTPTPTRPVSPRTGLAVAFSSAQLAMRRVVDSRADGGHTRRDRRDLIGRQHACFVTAEQ